MASYHSKSKASRGKGSFHEQGSDAQKRVDYFMDVLEYCYDRYEPTLQRLTALNQNYENVLNANLFPTISKMSIPAMFSMVQEALPNAMDMIFPDGMRTYTATPVDTDVDMETLDRVEYALNFMVRNRMRAKWTALPTIQDAIKAGVGYAAVVPRVVTPPATLNQRFIQGGRVVRSARQVGVGQPVKTLGLEYVGLGEIIPSDDGSDFNDFLSGKAVSHVFRVKLYHEDAFRRMFAQVRSDAEEAAVKGDVEAIIAQAADFNFNVNVPLEQIIRDLGGQDITSKPIARDKTYVTVPVIQCYGEHEVCWIANGTTEIFYEKDTYQTLHRPLIKASVTVDQNKWHPMNPAEAGRAIANGKNLYANLLMDMVIRATKPVMLYDKSRFGNKPPKIGRDGEVGVDGVVAGAIDYPQVPQINNGHIAVDNMLDRFYGRAVGQSASMNDPTPGMLRGGLHAFESLMGTMSGRQRLAAMILEMGFVEPLGKLAMIHMQINATGQGETFVDREYDQETGSMRVKKVSVTVDDLNAAYEISIDPRAKANTTTDLNERVTIYQATQKSPYYDPYSREAFLVGAYPGLREGLYDRKKAREIQEQMRQAEQQAAQQQSGIAGGPPGGTMESIERGAIQA